MDLVQVAELIKPQIESSSSNVILIDGVRSNDEIEVLTKNWKCKTFSNSCIY